MQLRLQVAITAVLAASLAAGWVWFVEPRDAGKPHGGKTRLAAATRVLIEPLEFAEDRIVVRAVGTGEALKSAAIHPPVAGEVVEIRFRAEQRVKKGAILLRLDDKHQHLAVRLTQIALRKAKRESARLNKLAAGGHASRARLETAQAELESASVRLAQARANLADRTITAPFDGIIGLTDTDIGDRVTSDTVIATLDDRSVLLVNFNLPEDYTARIKVGDRIAVRPSTTRGKTITGTISAMGSRIEPNSRSLRVRARIPNRDEAIRPGTSFEVELAFTGRRYPRVREVAVSWSRDGAYLWRVADGRAEKVFVKLVRRVRGKILVDGPLRAGDPIVVEGVQGLRAGQALDPAPFGAGAARKTAPRAAKGGS